MRHYLPLMGIDVWRFRTSVLFEYYRYDLLDSQNHQVGVLLADAVLLNEAEAQLVEKIAKATKKQVRGGLQTGPWESSELVECVILLGSRVAYLINSAKQSQIIRSYSPADLLQNTALKVQTWSDLKTAIKLMRE
ncbi:hypothetical protein [Candidatus Coxiella mudrowiae]|uniref:Uncharacterized protein n=1 Tax=Candidatus Coxiella mudrowiae TaxID=2054173 RepID=A0ABM5UV37_9COXI|nr:hypothetical protein [Candidatus Coxiella mudrowiae]AKQ33759.1 Uncharacterized protein CleRT_10960 [Candidatus Coxiella mudrowiae]